MLCTLLYISPTLTRFNSSLDFDFGDEPQYRMGKDDFTLSTRLYFNDLTSRRSILSNRHSIGGNKYTGFILWYLENDKQLHFQIEDGSGGWAGIKMNEAPPEDETFRVTVVKVGNDASDFRFYIYGVEKAVTVESNTLTHGNLDSLGHGPLYFGTRDADSLNSDNFKRGYVSDIRMYGRALSHEEVVIQNTLVCDNAPIIRHGLTLWAPLNEDQGVSIYDYSDFAETGTIVGQLSSRTWYRDTTDMSCQCAGDGLCFSIPKTEYVSYRFGFNGQEQVDELSGLGNHNTAEFWEYDTRLGRRWNTDPVVKVHESPYATFANSPIWFIDPSGADSVVVNNDGIIKNVYEREGDHRIFSTSGDELIFNDYRVNPQQQLNEVILPEKSIRYNYDYANEPIQLFNRVDRSKIKEYIHNSGALALGLKSGSVNLFLIISNYISGFNEGNANFDFMPTLHNEYGHPSDDIGNFRLFVGDNKGGFFLFGDVSDNSKRIYNLYDAGNFLTGKAYETAGFTWGELKFGSELNEYMRFNLGDTKADQDAVWNGFNYDLRWTREEIFRGNIKR